MRFALAAVEAAVPEVSCSLQYSLCFPKLVPRETAALVAVALSAARPAAVAVAASLLATKYGQRSNRQQ